MMGRKATVIRTPLVVRLQRFAHSALPVVIFLITAAAVLSLWRRSVGTANVLGRVEATRVNITAGVAGTLLEGQFRPFQKVQAGDVLAQLDDAPLRAQLEALRGDVATYQKELESTIAETRVEDSDRQQNHLRQSAELAAEVERCRLEVVDRHATIQQARVELSRLNQQLKYMQALSEAQEGVISKSQLEQVTVERDAIEKLVRAHELSYEQAQANHKAALQRKEELPPVENAEIEQLLAPIKASVVAAEARVREVEAMLESLKVRSPIEGTISAIFYFPGQGVRPGEPIMTVAAEKPSHITAYVPPHTPLQLKPGATVNVRVRSAGTSVFQATIRDVASQWEPLPLELLRDQNVVQLALAVQIEIPAGASVRPGELVDVMFPNSPRNTP